MMKHQTFREKPQLGFWQIWNMSFGFLGIQFGFALQNSNVSRIFQTLGADVHDIPILWIAAPITGLLVQPLVGYFSDKTWGPLGRRRPYFLVGAILATVSLFFMPNSPSLWVAAGMLWIMDASINISMEPFRAFVGDMLPDRQRTSGFAMQSFFIGFGAIVASALPWIMANWIGISNTAMPGEIPDSVKFSFYIGAVVLFAAVLWTIFTTREYSPQELEEFKGSHPEDAHPEVTERVRSARQYIRGGIIWLLASAILSILIRFLHLDQELYILGGSGATFGILQIVSGRMKAMKNTQNALYEIVDDLFHMPKTMKQLAIVQFFSWFALFAMWIYATSAVTSFHYGAVETASSAYNDGADWVGVLFAAYNGFAAVAAFMIPVLARRTGRKQAHLINLCIGGAGLISFVFIRDPAWLVLSMVGVGIAWASILSVPYAILSGSLPADKMGVYMGIFNFFIVIPQIMAASVIGILVRVLFDDKAIYALVLGGVFLVIAGVATLFVDDEAGAAGEGGDVAFASAGH